MTQVRPIRLYLLAGILFAVTLPAFAADLAVSRWVTTDGLPGDIRKLVHLSEAFAHGMGVAVILLAVVVLDPPRRRSVPWIALSAYGAGLVAQTVKIAFPRWRPGVLDPPPPTVFDTFQGWSSLADTATWFGRDSHSFPSGHTATAVGLAIGLGAIYPHGRWLFAALAAMAAVQRIEAGAHYLSDVLAGAACGTLIAATVVTVMRRRHLE